MKSLVMLRVASLCSLSHLVELLTVPWHAGCTSDVWHAVLYSGPDCSCLRAKTVVFVHD